MKLESPTMEGHVTLTISDDVLRGTTIVRNGPAVVVPFSGEFSAHVDLSGAGIKSSTSSSVRGTLDVYYELDHVVVRWLPDVKSAPDALVSSIESDEPYIDAFPDVKISEEQASGLGITIICSCQSQQA